MVEYGRGRFRRQEPEHRWQSVLVSVAVTVLVFALALGSMVSLPVLSNREHSTDDKVAIIRFPSPEARPPVPVVKRPSPSKPVEPVRPPTQAVAPPDVAPPIATQPQIAPPVVAPIAPSVGVPLPVGGNSRGADSANGGGARGASAPRGSGKGASIEPAGVSLTNRAANTAFVRDSILKSKLALIPELAATRAPSGREKAELEQSQRSALALRRRDLTSGNSNGLVVLQGKGMNGAGAVDPSPAGALGFGGSIPFTLLSSGPTREQRRKDAIVEADNQLRERRLEDRMFLQRDSIRADSVRADSLRADSLRRRVVPVPQ